MKCKETERSLKRNLSTLLSAAIVVSQLVGGGLTAFAADAGDYTQHTITYEKGVAEGTLATTKSLTVSDGNATNHQVFTAATISGVTKKGYEAKGYGSNSNVKNTDGTAATTIEAGKSYIATADATLTVDWKATPHKISYDAHGGEGEITDTSYNAGMTSVTLSDGTGMSNEGYTLKGWSTASSRTEKSWDPAKNTTTDFDKGSTLFPTDTDKDVTMYAIWQAKPTITLKFDPNKGTGSAIDDIKVIVGENAELPDNEFTKTGYHLTAGEEWNDLADGTGNDYANGDTYTATSADKTFYAKWVANPYTITFNGNGGTASGATTKTQTMTYDTAAKLDANTFTYDSNEFLGWSTDSNATTAEYIDEKKVKNLVTGADGDKTITLYAVWEGAEGSFSVTYDSNGGTGSVSRDLNAVAPYTVKADTGISRVNYGFIGWATDASATEPEYEVGDRITEIKSDITLYAVWKGQERTVDFDANEGTGSMATQKFVAGIPQKLNACAFKRNGYSFAGWTDESATSTKVVYKDQAEITELDSDIVLYAVWEPNDVAAAKEAIEAADQAATEAAEAAKKADEAAKTVEKDPTQANVDAAKAAADAANTAATKATTAATAAVTAAKATGDSSLIAGADDAAKAANAAAAKATASAKTAGDAAKAAQDKIDQAAKSDGSEKGKPVAEGKSLKDADGKEVSYVVTSADASNPEVEFKATEADKKSGKLTIPETVKDQSGNEYKVTSIADGALQGADVKEVTVPKTVKKIGKKAFYKSKAKKIIIKTNKKGNLKIGKGAFKNLPKKSKIIVKGVKGKAKAKLIKKIKKQTTASRTTVK